VRHNKCKLPQALRGLEVFLLVPRYKTAANAGVNSKSDTIGIIDTIKSPKRTSYG